MPPAANQAALTSGAVVAASLAVAAAVAIYEYPELRRYADDTRRRVAVALQSLSDGINPASASRDPPLFNRPEDAEGFIMSTDVDADDESRRRQREELLYWNMMRMRKEEEGTDAEKAAAAAAAAAGPSPPATTFDDILRPQPPAAYAYASAVHHRVAAQGVRQRGVGTSTTAYAYANPFADEHQIGMDDLGRSTPTPHSDSQSDIYSTTTLEHREPEPEPEAEPEIGPVAVAEQQPLIDFDEATVSSATLDRNDDSYEYTVASSGRPEQDGMYASIQAWARGSMTAADDEDDDVDVDVVSSQGQLTPTDSMSIIGSGRDEDRDGREMDAVSDLGSVVTPSSWSEVSSVSSDAGVGPTH
ncbi:hypothetical protein GMORB2_0320 [Geosmithia morbida]|uniref:Uncharacterized protein n=1 Tax=Geosmithia morbida TaxID=1094350 RepID=A0A9P4Z4M9_9HYPO|nr:uncharacterized protein GMORB2_0320 [Geosmithia morbida]KAF4126584.1 hypothetical protein GMORB2_0320 [Geosmithia morbida]